MGIIKEQNNSLLSGITTGLADSIGKWRKGSANCAPCNVPCYGRCFMSLICRWDYKSEGTGVRRRVMAGDKISLWLLATLGMIHGLPQAAKALC